MTIQDYCDSSHYSCPLAPPILNGNGDGATIELYNQQFWTIQNLVIRNWPVNLSTCPVQTPPPSTCPFDLRSGILVEGQDYPYNQGTISSLHVNNLQVYDVLGSWGNNAQYDRYSDPNEQTGGIVFDIIKGSSAIKTHWADVQVIGNKVSNVYRNGIHFHSDWSGNVYPTQHCVKFSHGGTYPDYTPSTGIDVENNTVHDMGGSGLNVGVSNLPKLAGNVASNGNLDGAGGVGLWSWDSNNATIEHNIVFNMLFHGNTQVDTEPFDTDYCDVAASIEYNFTFNNDGGFLLAMPQSEQTVVRYNISQDNGPSGRFFVMNYYGSLVDQAKFYDNSIYMTTGTHSGLLQNQTDTYKTAPLFENNAISYAGSGDTCDLSHALSSGWTVDYNDFYGPNCSPPSSPQHNVAGDPTFQYPGQGGYGSSCVPTGCYDPVTAYTLQTGSVAYCLGTQILNNGGVDYRGYTLPAPIPTNNAVDAGTLEKGNNIC